jgi:hypothetical protein
VGRLYLKYLTALNKLIECEDQIVQPQKRALTRRLLECSAGRFLELKHELVNIDHSEFSYLDDVQLELRMTPGQAELRTPSFFRRDRLQEINDRRNAIDHILR